jgi:hypothetical protein
MGAVNVVHHDPFKSEFFGLSYRSIYRSKLSLGNLLLVVEIGQYVNVDSNH